MKLARVGVMKEHEWALKPGSELRPGSSTPSYIHCTVCGHWFWAYQIAARTDTPASKIPCSGKMLPRGMPEDK